MLQVVWCNSGNSINYEWRYYDRIMTVFWLYYDCIRLLEITLHTANLLSFWDIIASTHQDVQGQRFGIFCQETWWPNGISLGYSWNIYIYVYDYIICICIHTHIYICMYVCMYVMILWYHDIIIYPTIINSWIAYHDIPILEMVTNPFI